MGGIRAALVRVTRAVYYCQNPKCAGQATYQASCCGQQMQAG